MIIYLLLTLTIGLGTWSIFLFRSASRKPLADGIVTGLLSASLGLFIYLYGTWVYLSIYMKYVFGITYVLFAVWFFFRRRRSRPAGWMWHKYIFIVLLGTACILYFTGTTGTPRTVELDFPLKKGRYFVLQGGMGLPTNFFHFSLRGAIYAMDIVRLNEYGGRASHIFSKKLADYKIFGDTIYAPCAGRIVRAYGDDPDNIPPNMARGPHNMNMVLMETDSFYVFMGHLKKGSLLVKEGDTVRQGAPLGCVGNSGFSSEPHLHIQVHMKQEGRPWYYSTPLYIHFNGRGYLLNEVIKKKHT